MRLIVTVDDNNGMMFNNRRQSQDRAVRQYMIRQAQCDNVSLWMSPYTFGQFEEEDGGACVLVDPDFLDKAGKEDYCYLEDMRLFHHRERLDQLIVIRWNRKYPADVFFDTSIMSGMGQARATEFPGYSHPKLTVEVYEP